MDLSRSLAIQVIGVYAVHLDLELSGIIVLFHHIFDLLPSGQRLLLPFVV